MPGPSKRNHRTDYSQPRQSVLFDRSRVSRRNISPRRLSGIVVDVLRAFIAAAANPTALLVGVDRVGMGAFSYATGFLLAGVVGSAVLIARNTPWGRRLGEAVFYSAIAFSGLLAVMIMHQISIGHWNAFFLVQAKYGHGIHDPFLTIAWIWDEIKHADAASMVRPLQSLIICAVVPALLAFLLLHRSEITDIEWFAAIHVCLFWVFPLIIGPGVSFTRAEANLLPLTLLMARLPRGLQLLALIVFAALYFETAIAFFKSILV